MGLPKIHHFVDNFFTISIRHRGYVVLVWDISALVAAFYKPLICV